MFSPLYLPLDDHTRPDDQRIGLPNLTERGEPQARQDAASAQSSMQRMVREGLIKDPYAPDYSLFGPDGQLTVDAIRAVDLKPDEIQKVQSLINDLRSKAVESFVERMRMDEVLSDLDNGVTAFEIDALPDEGQGMIDAFLSKMTREIGAERARGLLSSLDRLKFLAGFGRFNTRIQFEAKEGVGERATATYSFTSPRTGEKVQWGSLAFEEVEKYFGKAFLLSQ